LQASFAHIQLGSAKFSVQEKNDGVDAKQFDLDVGIIFKKDKTNRISLTPARIEANKVPNKK
jgi:hypothetical protein